MLAFIPVSDAAPLPVALPLFMAAVLAALNRRIRQGVSTVLAIATATATGYASASLLFAAGGGPLVYWFGGWNVHGGQAVGISFAIDQGGAAMAVLASLLTVAALIFSAKYFDTVGTLYHCLMLGFLGAMAGFTETGDVFNLFVFFELMSAAAFALCGYKSEEAGPLQGALNFAVTNTVGAFLVLSGIGLVYGRTGALNMAEIGRRLEQGHTDPLVVVAFTLIACGFLVKAAVVPFHFWLADAHAVAPAPVCVLFSGVMVELGLYAVVRVYWAMFSGVLGPHQEALRNVLTTFGVLTTVVGAVMCYAQRHLKRLLAFSTISHMGIMLLGVAMLTSKALAGAGMYAIAHGLLKGGLFLAAGIVLHRTGTVDELELRRMRPRIGWVGLLLFAGAAGLAEAPPFGTFRGEVLMGASATQLGYHWVDWVKFAGGVVTAGAIVRFGAGALLRWGRRPEPDGHEIPERPDTHAGHRHTPAVMWAPAVALVLLGLLTGAAPSFTGSVQHAAGRITDRAGYAARVLEGSPQPEAPIAHEPATTEDRVRGLSGIAIMALLASISLGWSRSRRWRERWKTLMQPLRDVHSGVIPDYITWMLFGVAVFGGAAILWMR